MPSLFRKTSVTMDPNLPITQPPADSSFPESLVELQMDMLDWCCHNGVFCDPSLPQDQIAQRHALLEECLESDIQPEIFWGRFFVKLSLASVALDVAALPTLPEGTNRFKDIRKQLVDARKLLIRKDANVNTLNEEAKEDKSPNPEIAELPLFTDEFESIVKLVDIHGTVAKFSKDLKTLQDSPKMTDQKLIKKIEQAVDRYKEAISAIKTSVDTSPLTQFLLSDLYKSSSRLLQRLLDDLNEAISDAKQEYAWPNLREQIMTLVKRWCQQVLSPSALAECGYRRLGGAAASEDISVSDWGGGGNEEEENYEPDPLTQPPENLQVLRTAASEDDDQAYLTADEEEQEEETKPTEEGSPVVMPTIDEDEEEDEEGETPKKPAAKKKKAASAEKPRRSRRIASENSDDDDDDDDEQGHEKENNKQSPRRSRRLHDEDPEAGPLPSARRKKRVPAKSVARAKKAGEEESDDEESIESPPPTAKKPAAKKVSAKKASSKKGPSSAVKKRKALVAWSDSSDDEDDAAVQWVAPTRRGSFPSAPPSKKRKSTGGSSKKGGSGGGGRKRVYWTEREEKALIEGARLHGRGNWETIRRSSKGILLSKTGQQLKDKWRNLEDAKKV